MSRDEVPFDRFIPDYGRVSMSEGAGAPWSAVLADREYRGVWVAYGLSLAGDELARVALAVLVFAATDSALATAAAYAVSFVPWLIGGPLLGGLGDRHPRRAVMISCHVASAVLLAAMALPGLNLPTLCALLFAVVMLAAPFSAARSALIRDVFPDDRYATAIALTNITGRTAQVIGYGAGGALIAALRPRPALLLDAATFFASALIIRLTVQHRPAPLRVEPSHSDGDLRLGIRLVFTDHRLRTLTWYAWLAAFHVGPAGVVVPYVSRHHGGPAAVGLLLAGSAFGATASVAAITHFLSQYRRVQLMPWLAILSTAPLIVFIADPTIPLATLLWLLAGAGTGYQVAANVAFVSAVPNERRAQAFGLVSSGLIAGQGAAILAAGALAERFTSPAVIAAFGIAGTCTAGLLAAGPGRKVK
jgi:MFS family permease